MGADSSPEGVGLFDILAEIIRDPWGAYNAGLPEYCGMGAVKGFISVASPFKLLDSLGNAALTIARPFRENPPPTVVEWPSLISTVAVAATGYAMKQGVSTLAGSVDSKSAWTLTGLGAFVDLQCPD